MPDVVLVLGPVAFADFEIPERIAFGGTQRLAVHKLPGGLRVIDALGRDDRELTWSGIFAGPDATARSRLLDLLRARGAVLPLTWDVFFLLRRDRLIRGGIPPRLVDSIPTNLHCIVRRSRGKH